MAKKVNFEQLRSDLLARSLSLLQEWFPAGKLNGREFRIGNIQGDPGQSLAVNIDSGLWKDFAGSNGHSSGGDLISLYAAIHDLSQIDAAKRLGGAEEVIYEDQYIPGKFCHPIPRHKNGTPTEIFEYKNADGILVGYVCRWDLCDDKKDFSPLTCWKRQNGSLVWKWKKWEGKSPVYGIEKLKENPEAQIIIVEGERKANHAQKLFPKYIFIGWAGGAGAIKDTDWSSLKYRYCWLWRDNDKAGETTPKALKKFLPEVHIVDLPEGIPEGWDLGNANTDFDIEAHLRIKPKSQSAQINDVPIQSPQLRKFLHFTHVVKDKPLATIENMRDLFNFHKVTCRYNVISKKVLFHIPGEEFSRENSEDASLACAFSLMKQSEVPTDGYKGYILRIADENQFNPVLNWITQKPWDGSDRLQTLYDTIESPETSAKELLIRRWLITAVCMAMGEGVDSAGCLVLQGPQDLGKTWWVKKLVPDDVRNEFLRTDATVDPKDKDSVSQVISYWIVELGEIGATFRKADIDALKAFITRDHDTMRRPYAEGDRRYPRRTALIASVDQTIYLHDTAGNRRFWTIPCTKINSYHNIDMQQVWAQVYHLVSEKGENWRLLNDEKAHIARINGRHMQIDPLEEMIISKYYTFSTTSGNWMTSTEIAQDLGLKIITQKETRGVAGIIRKLNAFDKTKEKSSSGLKLWVPNKVT